MNAPSYQYMLFRELTRGGHLSTFPLPDSGAKNLWNIHFCNPISVGQMN